MSDYTPSLLDLPDDILNIIFTKRLDMEKAKRRESLIRKHAWRHSFLIYNKDEKDKKIYSNRHYYDRYFLRRYTPKGGDIEDCKVFYFKDEKINTTQGLIDTKESFVDLSDCDVYDIEDFFKMIFFYEKLCDIVEGDDYCDKDEFDDYKFEKYEDINPYIAARDEITRYGDADIELELGQDKILYDRLSELAMDWAIEAFNDDDDFNCNHIFIKFIMDYINEYFSSEKDENTHYDFDDYEEYYKKYWDRDEGCDYCEYEITCCLYEFMIDKGVDDPYELIKYLKNRYD